MNDISLVAKFINFLNVAYVLYKSSKIQGLKHEPHTRQDIDMLTYMRNQYIDRNSASDFTVRRPLSSQKSECTSTIQDLEDDSDEEFNYEKQSK